MKILNFFYAKYTIEDLTPNQILKQTSLSKLKKQFDVLVIDDDKFPLLNDLKKHEFNITYKEEISDIKDVEAYQIILCDINGVGKFLGSENDGAYLGYQIKNKYPDKIVISYTADTTSIRNQKYLDAVDKKIPKGTSVEDWASLLDEVVLTFGNPIVAWKKTVYKLLEANVATKDIAVLEHKYVKAILNKSLKNLEQLCEGTSASSNIIKNSIPLVINILRTII